MKVTWDENTASFPVEQRKRGMQKTVTGKIDFNEMNIDRHGLLEEALTNYEGLTLDRIVYNQTLICLSVLKHNHQARAILSSPANKLRHQDIKCLFEIIEDHISTMDVNRKNAISTQFRHIFLKTGVRLRNGDRINFGNFTSRFYSKSSIMFKTESGILNQERLILTEHSNDADLEAKVLSAMKKDLDEIEEACLDIISRFFSVRSHHRKLISLIRDRLNQPDVKKSDDKYKHDDLYKLLYKIEERQLYKYENLAKIALDRGITIAQVIGRSASGSNELINIPHLSYEEYFIAYFLPKFVVEAIEVLFIIYTGWNLDAVISISEKNIMRHKGQFEIHSVKSKTDQLFHTNVIKSEKPKFFELIELILENEETINRYWKRSSDSIFSTWSTTICDLLFRPMSDGRHIKYIIEPYKLNHFSKKQLRDHVVNIVYLETNDPFLIRELLGHVSIQTSMCYLNQHVIRILHEANVRRFQDRMAATVVWAVAGDTEVVKQGLNLKDVDSKLLFPIRQNYIGAKAICDRWINSLGKIQFTIGREEIAHLNWQRKFYLENMVRLKSENPKEFLLNHLPRILFAAALYEFVKCSPYFELLDAEVLHDTY